MMINKRLIGTVSESKKYIAGNVALQWCSLAANIAAMGAISSLLGALWYKTANASAFAAAGAAIAAALCIRALCTVGSARLSVLSSRAVKQVLRERIYEKLLRLGASYHTKIKTSEAVQLAVEGVEQLETYFGAYLPQFFYSMLAPLTLFAVLAFIDLPSAAVLLVCVPLIPIAIAAVQTWAKKLLSKYWGKYTEMGDTFLENLQGLTTLKIYQADAARHEQMNREAEEFRKITMRVLTMQLNSITIMDLVAYGGAALGAIVAVSRFASGHVTLAGCLMILLLAADFFLPMRLLGSYFHIAMNGMAASDKIFRLLDLPEPDRSGRETPGAGGIDAQHLTFSYDGEREVLHDVSFSVTEGSFTAIVGESGCGKSTIAAILTGREPGYHGSVTVGGAQVRCADEAALMRRITYVSHNSHLFRGTVRDNLRMAKPDASDAELWSALERANLAEFLRSEQGLDTLLTENGSNFSGGQRQRLALARALMHDSPVYLFDEATSNIDVESEDAILAQIHELAHTHTVILISHRLANVVHADRIHVMEHGRLVQSGTHEELLLRGGTYAALWNSQQQLEQYGKEGATA
mgnify:CR=1 FL=1